MTKLFKKLILSVAAICAVFACVIFTACEPSPVLGDRYYEVSVLTPDGIGLAGVEIELLPDNGEAFFNGSKFTETTDDAGIAKFNFKDFSDSTLFTVNLTGKIPNGLNAPKTSYTVDINKDGYALTFQLTRAEYDTIEVNLKDANDKKLYRPDARLKEGFYELSCTTVPITLTDGDDVTVQSTFNLSGYNTVLVYYSNRKAFSIGTTDAKILNFNCTFAPVSSDGSSAKTAHAMRADYAAVLSLDEGKTAYLKNPVETSETGKIGGYPLQIDGKNYKATVNGTTYGDTFKVAGGKTLEIATADGKAGVAIVTGRSLTNEASVTIGTEESVEIELMERTINDGTTDKTEILWTTNACSISFSVANAGVYKFTITALSEIESDKVILGTVVSTGGISIVPTRVKLQDGEFVPYEKNDPLPEASATYIDYFSFSQENLDKNNNYRAEFSSNGKFSSLNEGEFVTYKILIEKVK